MILPLPPSRRLTFKGRAQDEAVLCSSTQTFVVKKVETSNLVMLIDSRTEPPPPSPTAEAPTPGASAPPGNIPGLSTQLNSDASAAQQPQVTVSALIGSHLELVHTAPRLRALDAVLADRPFGADEPMGGPENPDGSNPPGRTWEELLEEVQASPAELAAALEGRNALRVEGRWRGVDPGYLGTVLELVLLTAIEKGWSLDAVPAADAADALVESGFAPEVTHLCLRKFGTPASTGTADSQAMDGSAVGATASGGDMAAAAYSPDGEPLQLPLEGAVQLQESAVCRYFGVSLLSDRPRWESVEEFMTAWSAAVPEVSVTSIFACLMEGVHPGSILLGCSGVLRGVPNEPIERSQIPITRISL